MPENGNVVNKEDEKEKEVIDPDTGLTDIQLQVYERWCLGETLAQIARDMGMRRQTLSGWKNSKVWEKAGRMRTKEKFEAIENKILNLSSTAIDTIENAMKGKANKTQFLAAVYTLDRTMGKPKDQIKVETDNSEVSEMDIDTLAEKIAKELDAEE